MFSPIYERADFWTNLGRRERRAAQLDVYTDLYT